MLPHSKSSSGSVRADLQAEPSPVCQKLDPAAALGKESQQGGRSAAGWLGSSSHAQELLASSSVLILAPSVRRKVIQGHGFLSQVLEFWVAAFRLRRKGRERGRTTSPLPPEMKPSSKQENQAEV